MTLKVLASGSRGNCYLLESKDEILILECGIRYKDILQGLNFDLKKVVGCLITHEHKDHSKSFMELLRASIDIWLSQGTFNSLKDENYNYYRLPNFCKSENQFNVGRFTILPFQTQHDAAEPLGFLIQHEEMGKMIFATDTYYIQYKFSNLNNILVECNYSSEILQENISQGLIPNSLRNRILKSHFSLSNVKGFLEKNDLSQAKNIVLLHLSDGNSNSGQFKEEIEKLTGKPVYVAEKGLEIEL